MHYELSQTDIDHLKLIRENVDLFLERMAELHRPNKILDIAPKEHKGAAFFFKESNIETLSIDPSSGCTHIGDITKTNEWLEPESFDAVVCTEVLEHTLQPFNAVQEMYRILKPGGLLLVTVPFNFRIHGDLPDCWRFTEYGIQVLMAQFSSLEISQLETPGRPLMPIHYAVEAVK